MTNTFSLSRIAAESTNPLMSDIVQTRRLVVAAGVILTGIMLSGPVAVGVVAVLAPQPPWRDADTFIRNYSWIQSLPYIFGFLIAGGFILFMSSLAAVCGEGQRPLAYAALAFTAVSASMIFINYVLQTAFIPLTLHVSDVAVALTTMANPNSLGWTLEMYGYGVLGIATASAAPLFNATRRQHWIARLLVSNCVLSVLGAVAVPLFPGWVLTTSGMILGATWNLLVAVVMVLVILEFRPRHV